MIAEKLIKKMSKPDRLTELKNKPTIEAAGKPRRATNLQVARRRSGPDTVMYLDTKRPGIFDLSEPWKRQSHLYASAQCGGWRIK
jgi:hypothetical protein